MYTDVILAIKDKLENEIQTNDSTSGRAYIPNTVIPTGDTYNGFPVYRYYLELESIPAANDSTSIALDFQFTDILNTDMLFKFGEDDGVVVLNQFTMQAFIGATIFYFVFSNGDLEFFVGRVDSEIPTGFITTIRFDYIIDNS